MWLRCAPVLVLLLAACTQGGGTGATPGGQVQGIVPDPVFEKPEGYPFPMGNMSGSVGTEALTLIAYDYSVGAIDPNVWLQPSEGSFRFRAAFETPDAAPWAKVALTLEGRPTAPLVAGSRFDVTATLTETAGNAVQLRGATRVPATLAVTEFTEGGSGAFDRMRGTVTGALCDHLGADCQPMTLRFDTKVYQNDW